MKFQIEAMRVVEIPCARLEIEELRKDFQELPHFLRTWSGPRRGPAIEARVIPSKGFRIVIPPVDPRGGRHARHRGSLSTLSRSGAGPWWRERLCMTQQHEDIDPDRMAEVARLQEVYQAAVDSGCIEKARHARATLNDFLAAIGSDAPEAEEHLRRALNFPLPRSGIGT